jgi:beta-lactamase superfamily II metal-dependent hydrolase
MAKISTSVLVLLAAVALFVPTGTSANDKLAIHFMDVGQGDGALLISPQGQTVLFDNGALGLCQRPVQYLRQLGIRKIDYQVVSHYHADHIGCTPEVLSQFPLVHFSFDRGGDYRSAVFGLYVSTVGAKRRSAAIGEKLILDESSATPVQITFVAVNGNGIRTTNENDLSLLAHIKFGDFEAAIGGDLSGYSRSGYLDIESSVAASVGPLEVYKVHHHCSSHSTNLSWLMATTPRVAIVSAGLANGYGHPTEECLSRLHAIGTKTYWTSVGHGAIPDFGSDVVANGTIVLEVGSNDVGFTVGPATGERDQYSVLEGTAQPRPRR